MGMWLSQSLSPAAVAGRQAGERLGEAGGPGTKEQESLQTSKDNYLTCGAEPKDTRIN